MSVLRGTADNYLDLVARLDAFLTEQGHAWGRTYTGTGNGRLLGVDGSEGGYTGGPDSVAETFTLTATGANTFEVEGTVSGALANATVGTPYQTDQVRFLIKAGSVAFTAGDTFTLNTTPRWERIICRGVLEQAFRTGVNFTDVQNVYITTGSAYATATALPAELRLEAVWPTPLAEYTITPSTTTMAPRAWTLDYSDDGQAWTTADTRSDETNWSSAARTYTVPGTPGEHRYWRIRFTTSNSATLRIRQFQAKADALEDFTIEAGAFTAWRAPGADGAQEINLGLRLYSDQGSGTYNLRWYGSRFWDRTRAPQNQLNSSGQRVMSLYDTPMPFTFVANGHRLVPVVKVGTYYMAAYLGHRRSYDPPSADPWPCFIAANHAVTDRNYAAITPEVRNFWNAARYSAAAHFPNGAWVEVSNIYSQSGNDSAEGTAAHPAKVYPSALGTNNGSALTYVRENLDGSYALIPCSITCDSPRHAAGELDGIYWVTGFGNTAENVITRDGFAHLCFPNINRLGGADFAAIRLD